jgi:hypothetical protein
MGEVVSVRTIGRDEWRWMRPQGDVEPCTVTARTNGSVDIESGDGLIEVSVYPHGDGVEIRAHEMSLVLKRQSIAVIQSHPPYPISRWTVHYEGSMS